jgi:hypothetical protein
VLGCRPTRCGFKSRLPRFRNFFILLGALTSKPYAFQHRTWELVSQLGYDFSDIFFPSLNFQFRFNSITRILPNSSSLLPWISDRIRFNFPVIFNSLSINFSVSLIISKARLFTFFSSFAFSVLSALVKTISNFSPKQNLISFYNTQTLSHRDFLHCNTCTVAVFHFNLRELSPAFIARVRTIKTNVLYYGTFFDFKLSSSSYFFSTIQFYNSFFTYNQLFLSNSVDSYIIFSYKKFINKSVYTNFNYQNVSDTVENPIFSALSIPFSTSSIKSITSSNLILINSSFPSSFFTNFDLLIFSSVKIKSLPESQFIYNPFFINFFHPYYHVSSLTYSSILSTFINNSDQRVLNTSYSRLFNFRRVSRTPTIF